MIIQYAEPLTRAWERMKSALFKPFDLVIWFKVGFTAFLATMLDGGRQGGGANHDIGDFGYHDWEGLAEAPRQAWEWLTEHPGWFFLILFGIFFLFVVLVLLTWLSSRGKFMFLDNVVHQSANVTQPWHEYRREGFSLFLWRMGFGLITLFVTGILLSYFWHGLVDWNSDNGFYNAPWMLFVQMGLFFFFFIVAVAYIGMLLEHFVVPIMYKDRVTSSQAWSKFLSIHWKQLGHFIIYALIIILLYIVMGVAIIMFSLFTCCIGLLLIIIPYVGSVVWLPISYLFRAYSLEFLAQFADHFDLGSPLQE